MKNITVDLINDYKKHLNREEKSQATLEKYVRDITAFKVWMKDSELTKEKVLDYKSYLTENYAPASVNSMLSSINSFFEYNEWYELRVRSLKIQKKIFADKDKELSKAEYERLLKAAKRKNNEQLNLLMQTICSTGIRVSELRAITVSAIKSRQATINCKGKMRVIILPNELCKMLMRYIKKRNIISGAVFVTRNGRPLDRSNIWRLMKNLCEDAGVSKNKVFPHNLRHLFARTYYSLEKDIVRLADILGHSSVNTTRIYTMADSEIHRKQIQRLGLLRC
ncbi:MAG: tyrosine-type recombinase/integrase [Clostridia bacterium]|nr:tyrosine-type recombinase/integrase [Clostridia bacterium]